jgi:hypothetical protein
MKTLEKYLTDLILHLKDEPENISGADIHVVIEQEVNFRKNNNHDYNFETFADFCDDNGLKIFDNIFLCYNDVWSQYYWGDQYGEYITDANQLNCEKIWRGYYADIIESMDEESIESCGCPPEHCERLVGKCKNLAYR